MTDISYSLINLLSGGVDLTSVQVQDLKSSDPRPKPKGALVNGQALPLSATAAPNASGTLEASLKWKGAAGTNIVCAAENMAIQDGWTLDISTGAPVVSGGRVTQTK